MTGHVTNHVAEVAVPGQLQITVRAAQGQLEIGQEYDGERHGIYVQPDNVLALIRSMLRMIGMEDVRLYEQNPGGACTDVDWPNEPFRQERDAEPKPKDRTAAERQRRRRAKLRDGGDNDRDMNRDDLTVQEPLRLVAAE
jgi:hypothetical protein